MWQSPELQSRVTALSGSRARVEPLLTARERAALHGTPWFAALPMVVRHDILCHCDVRRYQHGEILPAGGAGLFPLNVVSSGAVRLAFGRPGAPALDYLATGQWFVDPALFGGEAALCAGTAHGSTTIGCVRGEFLPALMLRHPRLQPALLKLNHARVAGLVDILEGLSTLPLQARLARCLLRLAGNFGQAETGAIRIALPLTQDALAALVRIGRQRLNRELKALETQGVLRVGRQIRITNLQALQALAGAPPPPAIAAS